MNGGFILRQRLIDAAKALNSRGLNQGTSGNFSIRTADGLLITPSAMAYAEYSVGDMVEMDLDGKYTGRRKPSSEYLLHIDIYKNFPQAGCVLHAHPPWCTTLACLEKPIPSFHYMIAVAGGTDIRCAPYATYGTKELSKHTVKALQGRSACLLAHHGLVCYAGSPEAALDLAVEVESLARIYIQALQVGEVPLLSAEQMEEVLTKFKEYKAASI